MFPRIEGRCRSFSAQSTHGGSRSVVPFGGRAVLRLAGFLVIWTACVAPAQTNYFVTTNGQDSAGGTSWGTAFLTISQAVATCVDGDSVLVSNGIYSTTAAIAVDKGVSIIGVNGRDVTTVKRSGAQIHRVFTLTHVDAVLEGLTVSSGLAQTEVATGTYGGGIYMTGGTVRDCRITANKCGKAGDLNGLGCGVYMTAGIVSGCEIDNNIGTTRLFEGGGVFMSGGLVSNCLVRANKADTRGGGIYAYTGAKVVDCRLVGNEATYRGGGLTLRSGSVARNCLITDNLSRYAYGGGLEFYGAGPAAESCTIVGNHSRDGGGGVYFNGGGSLLNSIVYFNTDDAPTSWDNHISAGSRMQFCCTTPAVSGQSNTVYQPRFVDRAGDDFRLAAGPCVDAGSNVAWMVTASDMVGNPRLTGGTVDMGCLEAVPAALTCRFDAATQSGMAPLEVAFEGFVSGTNLTGLTYYWDFDDDGIADTNMTASSRVTHTYEAGTHSVRLTVSNAIGELATWTEASFILAAPLYVYVSTNGSDTSPYATWATASDDI